MEGEDDWLSFEVEEDGATEETADVDKDVDSCVELQELGVSHLAILKEEDCLTIPSSLSQAVPEAAWMQRCQTRLRNPQTGSSPSRSEALPPQESCRSRPRARYRSARCGTMASRRHTNLRVQRPSE
jgi:hypothetical protein